MKSLYVVIVGCGRLGSHLANLLSREGHRVVVIDQAGASFGKLSSETFSGFRVQGDASEPAILRKAKIDQADLLITATHADNVNLMVALVAKRVFGVQHVMARVYDPSREQMYHDLGLETVCPTLIAGEAFFKLVYRAIEGGGAVK
ncbi:MAG: TrkA family potassium uptake protein [Planctomycetes bacterium]|nr:TrkA family potassium uptake protein [Planctomycetota bacterium]